MALAARRRYVQYEGTEGSAGYVLTSRGVGEVPDFEAASAAPTLDDLDDLAVIYEVDFSGLATNDLASATESIDGLTWNTNNVAALGTHQVLNGTGIQLSAGTSLGAAATFTTTTRNTYYLDLPLSSIPGWDGRFDHIFEIYVPTLTLEGNGEFVGIGLYGIAASPSASSVARVHLARIHSNGGTISLSSTDNTTLTNGSARSGQNVIGLKVSSRGEGFAMYGTWASGWPAQMSADTCFSPQSGILSPYNHANVRLVLVLAVINDASPTTTASIERLRIRRA